MFCEMAVSETESQDFMRGVFDFAIVRNLLIGKGVTPQTALSLNEMTAHLSLAYWTHLQESTSASRLSFKMLTGPFWILGRGPDLV